MRIAETSRSKDLTSGRRLWAPLNAAVMTAVAVVASLVTASVVASPTSASASEPPTVPGTVQSPDAYDDGVRLWVRRQNSDELYIVHLARRDHQVSVVQKHRTASGAQHHRIGRGTRHEVRYDEWTDWEVSVVNGPSGAVTFRVRADGEDVVAVTDDGSRGGAPFTSPGSIGFRGDNTEFALDDVEVRPADSAGEAEGEPVFTDRFDYHDGLALNRDITSAASERWTMASGSLFTRGGTAHTGLPDGERNDPLSLETTSSSQFRLHTLRDDFGDVVVSFRLKPIGMVTDFPPAPFDHGPSMGLPSRDLPAISGERQQWIDDHVHPARAASLSEAVFDDADEVVIVDQAFTEAALPAAALAGARGASLLPTAPDELHERVAREVGRLAPRRAWVVGPSFNEGVVSELTAAGVEHVTWVDEGDPAQLSAAVADHAGADEVMVADAEEWRGVVYASQLAAQRPAAVLYASGARLDDDVRRHVEAADQVTLLGTQMDQRAVSEVEATAAQVERLQQRVFPLAPLAADRAALAGADPSRLWLYDRRSRVDALTVAAAAVADGGLAVPVDPEGTGSSRPMEEWIEAHRQQVTNVTVVGRAGQLPESAIARVTRALDGGVPAVETALDASQALWQGTRRPERVVIAAGDAYPDALAGGALVGDDGALLFTASRDDTRLPSAVRDELDRIAEAGTPVYLLGGTAAVSSGVEDELAGAGLGVTRLGGADRFETAAAVAEYLADRDGGIDEVALASGWNWPDAVSAGGWAASEGAPVLLIDGDELADASARILDAHAPGQRWVIGGDAVIPDGVVEATGADRVAGADRTATAAAVARDLLGRDEAADGDWFVAAPGWGSERHWGYALALTPLVPELEAPLLLTRPDEVGEGVADYLRDLGYDAAAPQGRVWARGGFGHGGVVLELEQLLGHVR